MEWFKSLRWADVMEWLNTIVANLSQLLASAGVPEEYRQLAAFGILYLGATVVVLLFILFLLKSFGRSKKTAKEIKINKFFCKYSSRSSIAKAKVLSNSLPKF